MDISSIYIFQFLHALLLTVAIEATVLVFMVRSMFKISSREVPWSLLLFSGFLTSFATLPYLWFVLPDLIRDYSIYIVVGEVSVFIMEAGMYFFILRLGVKRAFLLSFVCNIFSFLVGLALQHFKILI